MDDYQYVFPLQDEKDGSEITKHTLLEIKEKLGKGELKSTQVLRAFQTKVSCSKFSMKLSFSRLAINILNL